MDGRRDESIEGLLRELDDDPHATLLIGLAAKRLFAGRERPTIGRFELLGIVGSGGMGVVYAARDPERDRKVAVKVVNLAVESGADQARLIREARVAARLEHPAIVGVHEQGIHEGRVFLVMEFIEGLPSHRWLSERRPSWASVVALYIGAGEGLAAAHRAGFVHRDFKPANVLVDGAERPHIVDFGLARPIARPPLAGLTRSFDYSITATGKVSGTPGYMAPELFEGAVASPRTDLYAFCVALLEATRAHEVRGETIDALLRGIEPDPAARWPAMEPLLEALIRSEQAHRGPLGQLRAWVSGRRRE